MRRDERGGASRVDRQRRSTQVELLRDDRRRHVEQVPGHAERPQRRHVLDERFESARRVGIRTAAVLAIEHLQDAQAAEMNLLVLADRRADEHARAPAGEQFSLPAGVLQRAAHDVEHQPVLRIGDLDPPGREAEMQSAEFPNFRVIQIRAAADVSLVRSAQGRV